MEKEEERKEVNRDCENKEAGGRRETEEGRC
jgi:hypothetical protein